MIKVETERYKNFLKFRLNWNKSHEEEFFYKGYGKTEINMKMLAYYRHERIVEDIAEFGEQLLLTSAGGQNRIESY